jgi:hypothetical protein
MNASQDPQSDVGASRGTGLGGRRFAAAVLAAAAAGLLAQPAQAQTAFPLAMDMAGPVVPATVTVPDPFALAEQALRCDLSASCLQDLLESAAPALEPSPPAPSPAPAEPSEGGEPAAPPPKDDARASPGPPAAKPARAPRRQSPVGEPVAPASRPQLAELGSPPPRESPPPLPVREVPPRGSGLLVRSEPAPLLPAALSGLDWSPLLLNVLLAAGSLALLLFLLTATPQHSAGQVSYWLADRRSDLALLGTVLLLGLAVGYFIATSLG